MWLTFVHLYTLDSKPDTTNWIYGRYIIWYTVYPKKCAHGFCFAVLCCGYTLTDFPISIRLTSLALWQSNDCPSASKATLMNMDKYFMWIHYERLHNHNKAKHNKTVCIFLGIYCNLARLYSHGPLVGFLWSFAQAAPSFIISMLYKMTWWIYRCKLLLYIYQYLHSYIQE